jgi:hypothetical protein
MWLMRMKARHVERPSGCSNSLSFNRHAKWKARGIARQLPGLILLKNSAEEST